MLSRRRFLVGLFVFSGLELLTSLYHGSPPMRNGKLIRQGWVLRGEDV